MRAEPIEVNAGRACQVVAGTFCGGEVQGAFAQKFHSCRTCGFYENVRAVEHPNFMPFLLPCLPD